MYFSGRAVAYVTNFLAMRPTFQSSSRGRSLNSKLATQEKRVYNKNGLLCVVWGVLLLAAWLLISISYKELGL